MTEPRNPDSSEIPVRPVPIQVPTQGLIAASSEVVPGADGVAAAPRLLFNPPIDIYETEDGLVLYADLPGVTPEGLDLQVQNNRLTLFGRTQQRDQTDAALLHQEYQEGDFLRSFILSDEVDHDRIQAKLTNGLLRVDLPRAPRAKPRRIEVSPG
jgi:HSP20 family molecular chaperone IbpA